MFIDYITLMLTNMAAGLFLLAMFLLLALRHDRLRNPTAWAAGFGIVGALALITGLVMSFTWPVPAEFGVAYNAAFGEPTVLLGLLFLGAALSLAKGWPLTAVAVYGVVAGLVGLIIGVRVINLQMTAMPAVSGVGYIATSLGGILVLPALSRNLAIRIASASLLLLGAFLWLGMALFAYWVHLGMWLPQHS